MSAQLVKDLIHAGIHFGHKASRWNPKMKPYIHGKRNALHIIDVKETLRGLLLAKKFLTQVVAGGKDVLFVGTKRQARRSVKNHSERVGMHAVYDRWLGGTLTNFREIRRRVARLNELEAMEAEGNLDAFSKKEGARLRREMRKIQRNLGGIRSMESFPGVMVVVDVSREVIAVREARKAGIPVICLMDTDGDPDLVDIPIPGNDDSMRSIEIIMRELCDAVEVGKHTRVETTEDGGDRPQPRRRSSRTTTARAEEAAAEEEASAGDSPVPAAEEKAPEGTDASAAAEAEAAETKE